MARKQPIDTMPLHRKFGYSRFVEENAIRERLRAEADYPPGYSMELELVVCAAYDAAHKNDPTYAENSKRLREKWPATPEKPRFDLTKEEIAFLIDHFTGANDPLVVGILEKLKANQK